MGRYKQFLLAEADALAKSKLTNNGHIVVGENVNPPQMRGYNFNDLFSDWENTKSKNAELVKKIDEIIEHDDGEYTYGLRSDDKIFKIGTVLKKSKNLPDGQWDKTYVPGSSVIGITNEHDARYLPEINDINNSLIAVNKYGNDNVYLVRYKNYEGGDDPLEHIAKMPEIVGTIKCKNS